MACALHHRRRHRRLVRRYDAWPYLPDRHEPFRADSPSVAADWMHRLDRGHRAGGISVHSLPHRCNRRAGRCTKLAASVRASRLQSRFIRGSINMGVTDVVI